MYRIEFVNKDNYTQIHHVLTLESGLDNIQISPEEISSEDYFAREPRRIEFECLVDDWIEANILSGQYEHLRYISLYEVRYYEQNVLKFHGIIDTSYTSYDEGSQSVTFCCYDKLRLFSVFNDTKMLYTLMNGYHPGYVFGYFCQKIEQTIPIHVNNNWTQYSGLTLNAQLPEVYKIPWKELIKEMNSDGYTSMSVRYGFIMQDLPVFRMILEGYKNSEGIFQVKLIARSYTIYNHICFYENEKIGVNVQSDQFDSTNAVDNFIAENLTGYMGSLSLSLSTDFGVFCVEAFNLNDINLNLAPEYKSVSFSGNVIPLSVYPKGFYDGDNQQTECLSVLKAVLILHNLTIKSDASGVLHLINKNELSDRVFHIGQDEVTSFSKKRLNRSVPELDVLDVLMGETDALKSVLADYYKGFLSQIWEVSLTVDNPGRYDFQIFDKIVLVGKTYRITRLENDLYENSIITAWEI